MVKKFVCGACCALLVWGFAGVSIAQQKTQETQAGDQLIVTAAEAWLASVDKARYEQSWEEAGAYFQSMVTKAQWVMQVAAVRKSLGNFLSRVEKDKVRMTTLPGAPDGNYCVLTFETVFSAKSAAIETLTMMQEKDGQWRMAGYFIK